MKGSNVLTSWHAESGGRLMKGPTGHLQGSVTEPLEVANKGWAVRKPTKELVRIS